MSELSQQAEEYARSGWRIFPIKPRDKTPLTTHGVKDASNKLDTVRAWWQKWPTANIGLNCGASGLVVLDLDKHGEHDGLAQWGELQAKYHFDACTSTSLTGGGGRHLLFKCPQGVSIKNSAGRLAPGIDVRGEGGYIVLPPSVHPSGKLYQWSDENRAIVDLPQTVIDILTHEPDPWQIFTLKDAFAPREPMVWVVEGIIPEASLSIWYGPPGSLKSMILADMAVSVAAGYRWLTEPDRPLTGIAVTPGAVMWLDFDNGQRRTHERIAALARARKLSDAVPVFYASMPSPTFNAGDTESVRALAARLADRNVRLLVIDNLGKIAGGVEENSGDMEKPMTGLRWLAETGCAVIVIHHQRKSNGLNVRAGESLRGHGSIEANLDLALQVARDGPMITLTATKVRGPDVKQFSANFAFEHDANQELTTARFWPAASAAEEEQADQKNLRDNILETVGKFGPMSANDIYDAVGGNRNHVLDVLRQMNLEKQIAKKQVSGGKFLISLP